MVDMFLVNEVNIIVWCVIDLLLGIFILFLSGLLILIILLLFIWFIYLK